MKDFDEDSDTRFHEILDIQRTIMQMSNETDLCVGYNHILTLSYD